MPRFPQREADVLALARIMIEGLRTGAQDFPAPPVPPAELKAMHDECLAEQAQYKAADAAKRSRRVSKTRAFANLKDGMRANLRYAEAYARKHPERLTGLGWGPKRKGRALAVPGEVRNIRIAGEGDTWLVLEWQPPTEGGEPAAYKIQRRKDGGAWEDTGTSIDLNELVRDQPRGVQLEFRVLAVNKAGEGRPSGTVAAVL